ncbi:MAG TPA: hypothetical protein V6D50_11155 [Chroococcales cyanobacterium]|jgi:hypothetical protein
MCILESSTIHLESTRFTTWIELKDMIFTQSNSRLNSEILRDGEYYAFSKEEGEKICLGYIYTTWCGSHYGMYINFFSVGLGKPLSLVRSGHSQSDKGQLKTFSFDSRNPKLLDDVYNRAIAWLNKMQAGLKYPQLDESAGCRPVVIQINRGVLSTLCEKKDYLFEEIWGSYKTHA